MIRFDDSDNLRKHYTWKGRSRPRQQLVMVEVGLTHALLRHHHVTTALSSLASQLRMRDRVSMCDALIVLCVCASRDKTGVASTLRENARQEKLQ